MDKKSEPNTQKEGSGTDETKKKPKGRPELFRTIDANEWKRIRLELLEQQGVTSEEAIRDLSFTDLPMEKPTKDELDATAEKNSPGRKVGVVFSKPGNLGPPKAPPVGSQRESKKKDCAELGDILSTNYILRNVLGEGVAGRVFLAEHSRWRTLYAIKVLHPWVSRNETLIRSLRRSFTALEKIRHERIVRPFMLEYDKATQSVYYFMDFVEGKTLRSFMSRRRKMGKNPPFSREEVLMLLEGTVAAVRFAHKRQFFGGNIQPSRILLSQEVGAKIQLLSFGLLPSLYQGSTPLESTLQDSMSFLAPELHASENFPTAPSDVYSLGVVTYQLLTGSLPGVEALAPSDVHSQWPKALDRVVSRATAPKPEERYPNVDEFWEDLKDSLKSLSNVVHLSLSGSGADLPEFPTTPSTHSRTSKRPPEPNTATPKDVGTPSQNLRGASSNQGLSSIESQLSMQSKSRLNPPPGSNQSMFSVADSSSETQGRKSYPLGKVTLAKPRSINSASQVTSRPSRFVQTASSSRDSSSSSQGAVPSAPQLMLPISTWPAHEQPILGLALSPDGKMLASCGAGSNLRFWATGSWTQLQNISTEADTLHAIRWSPDSRFVALVVDENTVQVWDTRQMSLEFSLPHDSQVHDLAWHTKGYHLYTACADHNILCWNLRLRRVNGALEGHNGGVRALLYYPDSNTLISGGEGNHVKMWNIAKRELIQDLFVTNSPVCSIATSSTSALLATGHVNHTVEVRDFISGSLKYTLRGHEGPVSCLLFGPKDRWIASGSLDHSIRIWNTRNSQPMLSIERHNFPIQSICHSREGHWLATAAKDKEVCIWDTSSW